MNRRRVWKLVAVVALVAVVVLVVWLGSGVLWRMLLAIHGRH